MTDPTKQTDAATPDPEPGSGADPCDSQGGPGPSARPTVAPPFDLAAYAQTAAVPSLDAPSELEWLEDVADTAPAAGQSDEATLPPDASSEQGAPGDPGRQVDLPGPPALPRETPPPSPRLDPEAATGSGPPGVPVAPESASAMPPTRRSHSMAEGIVPPGAINSQRPSSSAPPSQRITPPEMDGLRVPLTPSLDGAGAIPLRPAEPRSAPSGDSLLSLANFHAPRSVPHGILALDAPSPTSAPTSTRRAAGTGAVADPVVEMQERFALGDYSGALAIAESLLATNPTHPEAREYSESCRSVLQQMYMARIGPLDRVPVVAVPADQLRWLSIDHKSGFILSLVDGVSSFEMILDICGMPTLEALRMLDGLVQQRVVAVRDD